MSTEDERVRIRLAELMSSAGLGYNQISQEILFLLPTEFVNWYIVLWERALGPAGTGDSTGAQLARDAHLGKVQVRSKDKGVKVGAGGGGQGRKWRKLGFSIRDEAALRMKDRIDRRLRSIAREIRLYDSGADRSGETIWKCGRCGKIMENGWVHCPFDGSQIIRESKGKGE